MNLTLHRASYENKLANAVFLSYRTCILRFDISHFSSDGRRKSRLARATDGIVLSRTSRDKSKVAVPEFDAQMTAHILYVQKYRYGSSHTARRCVKLLYHLRLLSSFKEVQIAQSVLRQAAGSIVGSTKKFVSSLQRPDRLWSLLSNGYRG
jgi:hypothetical protein